MGTGSSGLRHTLLAPADRHGFEYGVLQDLEDEIVRLTGAEVLTMPSWRGPAALRRRVANGTRYAPLRRLLPRQSDFRPTTDVLWVVLMGAEASTLDLFRAWDAHVGYRIVYLFDTFESQLPTLRRFLDAARWDLLVTSFHGAVPMLERETNRRWHAVAQGVNARRFTPLVGEARNIAVSSYGRRLDGIHRAVDAFCEEEGLHYEASIAASLLPMSHRYLYRQYAWHLRQSWFTVAWPVELTHPARAGALSPMTCRWFEAGAAATTLIGRAPRDPIFEELFGRDAVVPLDPMPRTRGETREALASLWARRREHLQAAEERRAARIERWTWEARVREILALAKLPAPPVKPSV